MRRIKSDRCQVTPSNHLYDGKNLRVISERDYQLLTEVARAAEAWAENTQRNDNQRFIEGLLDAIAALNAPGKGRKPK